uniref:Alpha pinene synthase, chloroplastic n=1 Tax=Chamaecyparis formosensis TaxID=187461 RepID=PIN_CHAFM|nr:RecName: Full=Alpha pinene synthase, chloroplastic; Short=Cf-Pin; Flags: Precursor [Chamaecyparis formosensis]ABW80964.1 alpha pinene synthase [Chamaecyparis formosensis]
MSLGCITPLASAMVGPKLVRPLIHHNPLFHHKPLNRPYLQTKIPLRSRVAQNPINMALITTDEGITRRIGNHHPNLWDDDFIQSLSKAYEAPSYGERAEKLIKDVRDMFNALPLHSSSADDLIQHLSLVDSVERLGIDRHFQNEIKTALDYVYRYWSDAGIGCGRESTHADLNTTALGFRILRLHRYSVSSDVLQQFVLRDGPFLDSNNQPNEDDIKNILNLFRGSLIAFPGENVLDDAKSFTMTYLKQVLPKISNLNLSREIKFNLEYGWHTNVPRLEARTYIDIYGEDSSWASKSINNIFYTKLLELAKLDFNIIQSLQQQELQILSRWWMESDLGKLDFARHRHVEYYLWAATGCIEPKYSAFRIGFAKLSALVTYLDDMYDTYDFDEIKIFTKAIKRWDASIIKGLPEFMKVAFKAFDEAVKDMAQEAKKTQGRDTLDYARKAWEVYIDAYMKEAEWLATGYMPSLEEYLENGKVSAGSRVVTLQPILSLDVPLSDDILKEIDYPSRFDELLCLTLRLRGDTRTFKAEADRGEVVSCITCYMKDHPGSNEEDALNYLNSLIDERLKELNWEYLKTDNVPIISKGNAYNLSKGLQLLYKERDGFTVFSIETKNFIYRMMIGSIPI